LLGNSTPRDRAGTLAFFEEALLAGDVSLQTHETILKQLNDPAQAARPAAITGLILGSPEFQKR
jgi:hypothetical protein